MYILRVDYLVNIYIKKIRGLLVPWFVFGIINIIASQIISFNEHKNLIDKIKCFLLYRKSLENK